jgi:hypothetical protein
MKNLHIATSPLSNRIYAGTVCKDGVTWASQTDVTGAACGAVAEHVINNGEPVIVTYNGKPAFRITVEKLEGGDGE